MPVAWEQIEPLLMRVGKPARYVGGEFNQIVKPRARVRACLAFPDLYEIGMSYHGYRLLYERLNRQPGWAAERAFCPWPDYEALLREHGVPLYSLETRRSLAEFHWVGFTLQHEVNFTNILTMLDLSGIPLESKDRTAAFPILIGGGEGAWSPEPISPFLDAFVLGDGEEIVLEITALIERALAADWDRTRILRELARLPGVYVPEFYEFTYHADGTIAGFTRRADAPDADHLPLRIHKRYFDVGGDLGSIKPVVPLLRTVHDRLVIEIRRGCVNGCRFCQAGMVTRPVKERSLEQIVEIARQGIENTGYDEISLLSLSSADYTEIAPLVRRMTDEFGPRGVSVSLPSLRINGFDVKLVDEIARVRKSGFTFAPEAGTTRLREVINKPVDQQRFFEIIEDVFARGWRTVKFYFMIGLPTETQEDLDGIIEICEKAAELGERHHRRQARVNVTLSPFVPKCNTPFQWEAQPPREELERRYQYVRGALRHGPFARRIDVKTSDTGGAFIEAALARGDRRMARAVRRAWELGARFDGWDECFRLGIWLRAFDEVGLDPTFYANRERPADEILPFDHLDSNVGRRFLWIDQRRARKQFVVEKCDTGKCAGCAVCNDVTDHTLSTARPDAPPVAPPPVDGPDAPSAAEHDDLLRFNRAMEQVMAERDDEELLQSDAELEEEPPAEPCAAMPGMGGRIPSAPAVQRLRFTYTRLGALRYLSHLDFQKVMGLVLRRAGAPLAYSHGFNPQPKVQFAPPLSLGMGGRRELVDIQFREWLDPADLLARLNAVDLDGLEFLDVEEVPIAAPSLEMTLAGGAYRLELTAEPDAPRWADIEERLDAFAAAPEFVISVQKKKGLRQIDLRQSVGSLTLETEPDGKRVFLLMMTFEAGSFVKPHEALGHVLGQPLELGVDVRVDRVELLQRLPASHP
ncbi:MAG TPA: TIGR03960 family B12-binding radical SAM protein [Candidatus Sumerlaeota bacterium]|nr:TIGR03960 family B12-binding radical SAM protein [Candidatus Sumerlaeota bacterium]